MGNMLSYFHDRGAFRQEYPALLFGLPSRRRKGQVPKSVPWQAWGWQFG